ncbi:MAG: hypothetical protein M1814_006426 [Vezdaea aestivalis]|nr:MAG: hypothetical protein M1814_006426 [Vezdaea aestivalis]
MNIGLWFFSQRSIKVPKSTGDSEEDLYDASPIPEQARNSRIKTEEADTLPISSPDMHPTPGADSSIFGDGLAGIPATPAAAANEEEQQPKRIDDGLRELLKTINDIGKEGEAELEKILPRIVVVGDQSTGKSSLVEGLSEIRVPRSSGRCTSCPFEIQLMEDKRLDAEWACEVELVKKFMHIPGLDTQHQRSCATGNADCIGPWLRQVEFTQSFMTTRDKDALENILFWAHKAIMNPDQDPQDFASLATMRNFKDANFVEEDDKQTFSPNVIRVNITGPDCPSLSFVDLPGIINNPERNEDKYTVDLVRSLMKSYVSAPRSLILCTIAMTEDQANSTALSIINKYHAANRAVGVLTKPDRTQSEEEFMDILQGKKYQLDYGYFVCRQPNKDELKANLSHREARNREEEYFADPRNWPFRYRTEQTVQGTLLQDRFGTHKLSQALSDHLARTIAQGLPNIKKTIDEGIETNERELANLPELREDEMLSLLNDMIRSYHTELSDRLDGASSKSAFRWTWQHTILKTNLTNKLIDQGPELDVYFPPLREPSVPRTPVKTPGHRKHQTPGGTGGKRQVINLDTDEDEVHQPPKQKVKLSDATSKLTFDDISQAQRNVAPSTLPGVVNPKVYPDLVEKYVSFWETPLQQYIEETSDALSRTVSGVIKAKFSPVRDTLAFKEVNRIMQGFHQRQMDQYKNTIMAHYQMQQKYVCTLDFKEHNTHVDREENTYKENRLAHRKNLYHRSITPSEVLARDDTWKNKAQAIKEYKLPADEYAELIPIAAHVKAYYIIASKRFIDFTMQYGIGQLFAGVRDEIVGELRRGFGIAGDYDSSNARAKELLREDEERRLKRQQLLAQRARLQRAKDILLSYQTTTGTGTVFTAGGDTNEDTMMLDANSQ